MAANQAAVDDLAELEVLTDDILLACLQSRHKEDKIYVRSTNSQFPSLMFFVFVWFSGASPDS